jgi:ribosomal protein S18 acetylase RimI-like enzyme
MFIKRKLNPKIKAEFSMFWGHQEIRFGTKFEETEMAVTKDSLIIRRYESRDKESVRNLHWLALSINTLVANGPWDDGDLHDIQNEYLNKNGEFLVGVLNNKIVGMGALRKKTDKIGEIKLMRVHPDYQRRGYGQLILDKLEAKARQFGYLILCLDTTTKQVPAQNFYKRNGYHETHRAVISYMETIFFEKHLE